MKYLLLILTVFYTSSLCAIDYSIDTFAISSEILKETSVILIFKPIGLQKSDSVSMIYLLDGEFSKYRFDHISKGKLSKPTIGIGIINTDRRRDMLTVKQPERFLEFIESELIPKIESGYLINKRILYGHSFAGGFTIYSMIHQPGLFDKYIASSPTPIMNMIDTTIYKQLDNSLDKGIKFYFSYGSQDMKQVKKWATKLQDNLLHLDLIQIDWKNEIYDGENHSSGKVTQD